MKTKLFLIMFSIFFLANGGKIDAQNSELTQYQIDSLAVESYIDSVIVHVREPIVLKMADTLFNMAGRIKNRRRQAGALSYIVDYWYILKNEDSLFVAIDNVQKFSKKYNQPIYYYFSWQRKITYYINANQPNMAMRELNLMQEDAIKANDYAAQVDCYYLMGRVYHSRSLHEEAYKMFSKSIEMIDAAPPDVEISGIFTVYQAQSTILHILKKYDEEKIILDKMVDIADSNTRKIAVYLRYCSYYLVKNDISKAEYYANLVEQSDYAKSSVNGRRSILDEKARIAHYKGNYREELKIRDSLKLLSNAYFTDNESYANAYLGLGEYKKAIEYYQEEIKFKDSIRNRDIRNEINEMTVMLDVNRLKAEKDKAELETKTKVINVTMFLSFFLFILLVFALIMWRKYYRTNKKLRISDKNLGMAVERLEIESNIKSDFIRHLSHEVRTPLNAIVGFTSLIAEKCKDDAECNEYSQVVDRNVKLLVKLVEDSVAMSNYGEEGHTELTNINTLFYSAIDYLHIKAADGVQVNYVPCTDPHNTFMLNKEKLTIILSNLLHNSSKFTKKGSIVMDANIDSRNNHLVFTVTDTGIGIPKDKIGEIFDYFSKVDSMTQGLGLGLPLSRHLAETMSGTLILDETYTSGCRFILTIPIPPEQKEEEQ